MENIKLRFEYRADIDGLRAIAVLLVVIFHTFPILIPGGFIGVDIFFVISGYLITNIIISNLITNSFSFINFYKRRINRIFPALCLVLLACLIFGWFSLSAEEFKQLGKHIFGGTSFLSNIISWREAGYFDKSSYAKPLLHLWSLGIEEQFYIIWPLLIWLMWSQKTNLWWLILLFATSSFFLNVILTYSSQVAAFYLPFTRIWELMCGSLISFLPLRRIRKKNLKRFFLNNLLSLIGIILIIIGAFKINNDIIFPGWWALIPVIASILIIISDPNAWINKKFLSNKIAVWFGLISFPLYLWHWPLISFASILTGNAKLSNNLGIIIILTSIILGYLTYILIEKKFRILVSNIKVILLLLIMLGIGLSGIYIYLQDGIANRVNGYQLDNKSTMYNCQNGQDELVCELGNRNSKHHILAFGDSHLRVLVAQILEQVGDKYSIDVVQTSSCFMGDAVKFKEIGNQQECNARIQYLKNKTDSYYDLVITTQRWHGYNILHGNEIETAIKDRISVFGIPHHKLIILGSTSDVPIDCERSKIRPIKIEQICKQDDDSKLINKEFIKVTKHMKIPKKVYFIYPYNLICPGNECIINDNGVLNYSDSNHLSYNGSKIVVEEIVKVINR